MECPHCHAHVAHPVTTLRQRRKANGLCIDCGQPKLGADQFRVQCEECRLIRKIKRVALPPVKPSQHAA